jgi:phenylpyruvate tautomerase PptA (4-oxalocrotonate tautomerase family)
VVAQNGPRDGQKRRILAAVNEAIATVLQMDVVNPNVGAVILQDS